jgi:glycosyltransferase involved in cell wall biosynthesis
MDINMKVLHIFNEINFSGAEIMYATAASFFREEGIELIALGTGPNFGSFIEQFKDAGIQIFHRPLNIKSKNPFYIFNYMSGIIKFVKYNNIDVIHVHRSNVFWYFSLCGYLTNKKTISSRHSVFKSRKISWLKHYFLRLTARKLFKLTFHSIGESVYLNELNYYKNPSIRINNWYDSTKFFPAIDSNEKSLARENLNINKSAFVIISTGACTINKNHADIIRTLSILKDRTEVIYMHLGIGDLMQQEKALADALGVSENVLFLNNRVNVRDYLIASDVFVMTSKLEGLGNASIEAMACGLPIVLYNSPGLRDLIQNDDNGLLVDPDYKILAEGITKVLQNPLLTRQRALNALNHVKQNYCMPICVSKISQLYRANL